MKNHHRALWALALCLPLAIACDRAVQTEATTPIVESVAEPAPAPSSSKHPVDGWDIGAKNTARAMALAPQFSLKLRDGQELDQEDLRGTWTILAFWGLWSEDSLADIRYMQALYSATSQDPDLGFATIHMPPPDNNREDPLGAYLSLAQGLEDQGAPFPTADDADGQTSRDFGIISAPTYILVGPDLTIEARRGALHINGVDSIKPMIQGIAEIRSQISVH